jgi:hypothetical protein
MLTIQFNKAVNMFEVKRGNTVIGSYAAYTMAMYRLQYEVDNG